MDTTYIVLDGNTAELSADGFYLTWRLDEFYFKDLRSDEFLMAQLHSAQFMGSGITPFESSPMKSAEIYANINLRNQSNTTQNNSYNILGIVNVDIDTTNNTAASVVSSQTHPSYAINRFNEISIYCDFHGYTLDFTTDALGVDKSNCVFILKISKAKN
jgi:hypothetical protein